MAIFDKIAIYTYNTGIFLFLEVAMRQIPLFEVKNKLSYYVNLAEQGERIEITRHGKTSAVLLSPDRAVSKTSDINSSPFYISYLNFRKKLEAEGFTEDWDKTFDIKRSKSIIRHPEDFE